MRASNFKTPVYQMPPSSLNITSVLPFLPYVSCIFFNFLVKLSHILFYTAAITSSS